MGVASAYDQGQRGQLDGGTALPGFEDYRVDVAFEVVNRNQGNFKSAGNALA